MSICYSVNASVVDIRSVTPPAGLRLFIDTNVWIFQVAPRLTQANDRQRASQYNRFLTSARRVQAEFVCCGLSLSEVAHSLEKFEHEVFCRTAQGVKKKEFRHNHPSCRNSVCAEIDIAWQNVTALADVLQLDVSAATTASALLLLHSANLDGYDAYFAQLALADPSLLILSDDGDFCTVAGLTLLTANEAALQCASDQGKLVTL